MLNRRDFLQFTGLSGVALGAGMVPFQALAQSQAKLTDAEARHFTGLCACHPLPMEHARTSFECI